MKLTQVIGMLQSRLIYDFKPFIHHRMERFYAAFVKPGDLCFDIGAHTGNRSEVWLKMGAKVIAIEPQPVFVKLISKKTGNHPNLILLQQAVGEFPGSEMLYISHRHPAISTLSTDWIQTMKDFDPSVKYESPVETVVTTLDALIEKHGIPAFCKIDVEGYEEKILKGLSVALPALSFEFFPTTPLRTVACIKLLEKFGNYRYNWSFIETFRFNSEKWLTGEEMAAFMMLNKSRKSGDIYAELIHEVS